MYINKEGKATIIIALCLLFGMGTAFIQTDGVTQIIFGVLTFGALILLGLILWFFRMPKRRYLNNDSNILVAPADGKVVVIEKTKETEYFKDERIQISIFMSPLNVHCQWYPTNGTISYVKYHPGKHLVAWHPKSSTENERSTVVIRNSNGKEILVRQIAGAVARRIVTYSKSNQEVERNDEMGFIKFGSRVDVFLPLDADINVELDQMVVGNETLLAKI